MPKSTQELKYKRLKVGRACYVCRSKKIKCDGLRPCMQCKARGRNCVSSKSDLTPESNDNVHTTPKIENASPKTLSDPFLFSCSKPTAKTHTKPSQFHIDFNHESLTTLSSFGKLTQWKNEPLLPSKYSHTIEMPPFDIQMSLINHFFEKRYTTTPVLPKRLFFKHLHSKGPLITPLLLNAMYCLSSKSTSLKDTPKPYVFFNRARKLLDDFLDTPRISTVAALYLMSLYEPTDSASVDHHCRSWIYNGMASRMAIELGLNVDTPYTNSTMSDDEVELRRRVFWHCYCFDKCISTEWQRVWSISTSLAKSSLPRILPEDDPQEQLAVRVLQEKIKLSMINELGLHLKAAYMLHNHVSEETFHQQLESYLEKLLKWRDNVADTWQISVPTTMHDLLEKSHRLPGVGHVLSIFYFMLCDVLLCLPVTPQRLSHRRLYAAAYIKSIEHWFNEPDSLYRCEFIAVGLVAAARIHACFFNDSDPEVVQQSHMFVRQCSHLLDKLQTMTTVSESAAIVKNIVQLIDSHSNPNSPSTSPTVSVGSTQEQPFVLPMYMDLWQHPTEKYDVPYQSMPVSGFVNNNNGNFEQNWSPNLQYPPYASPSTVNILNQPYYPPN